MDKPVICPRCGAENRASAMNCVNCKINLKFAMDNPAEMERIRQEDAHRKQAEGDKIAGGSVTQPRPILLPTLLLLGAFVFAFCLGEAVHELGHFLAHRFYGVEVGIHLDPFGGSRILQGSSAPHEVWGITSLAGPLFNLLVALTITLSLWRQRKPALLPLLLWGPIALVQEGVTFSLGMLTPGGDAQLIAAWGVPAGVLIGLGVLFLVSGIAMICWLLPMVDLAPEDALGRKFGIVLGGMVTFMVLRLLVSGSRSPGALVENTIPLVFSVLLATIVVWMYAPLHAMLNRISSTRPVSISRPDAVISSALGVGMVLLQWVILN